MPSFPNEDSKSSEGYSMLDNQLECTGIPKFYRWLSERYPLINQPIASTHVPIIDNLYLDMNGIIHNCTHGNDPNVKLTEEEMILKIFAYIERLFQIIQPRKLLFAAIDGMILLAEDTFRPALNVEPSCFVLPDQELHGSLLACDWKEGCLS